LFKRNDHGSRFRHAHSRTGGLRSMASRGQAMTEFSLVLPVFILLLFGTIFFGNIVYAYSYVSYAAREASRYAAVHGSTNKNPATSSSVQNFVTQETAGLNLKQLSVATSWSPDNNPGSTVKVQVQYNMPFSVPLVTSTTLQLISTSQMVVAQ
jgi:Flp pilus assembly protein TadG